MDHSVATPAGPTGDARSRGQSPLRGPRRPDGAPPRGVRRRGRDGAARRERGIVVVWFALMLIVLLGFAGFAVDLSNWWFQAERLQRSADAGAHAGVVFLPADMVGATARARDEVGRNGFRSSGADANATVAVTQEPNPNRLRVAVETDVPTYFAHLFGIDTISLTREAVAEYIAPVPMGSPENKLGNDPARGQNAPQFWINVAGPDSTKKSGDRYQAKECNSGVAGCGGGTHPGIDNDEYSFDGYFFALDVTNPPPGQPLDIQVYDPAMVYVGDFCERNVFPDAGQRANLANFWYGPDAVDRYEGGLTEWCTGDQRINGHWDTETTFIVREPDDTPWSDVDNPVVDHCTTTMPAWNPSSSGSGSIYERLLAEAGTPPDGQAPWTFAEVFRRNVTLCSIPAAEVKQGNYILQVRSNSSSGDPLSYSSSNSQGGHNRMSIFAGFGDAGLEDTDGSAVSINARGKLPIYANAEGANTEFYLARVLPYDAGRTLRITLFDIGDAAQAGTLRILPPSEYASNFSGCSFERNDGASLSTNASTCTMTNVSAGTGFDGKSVNVDIPIPEDYTCDQDVLTGCWVKVLADFPAGVNDTTTWSAAILGNPIRLVE